MQPATKALAQMLAGRTAASGQLGHARAILAQVERLVGERAHNRLNPAEREEFFEQVARLKLTLADADLEAEVQAEEEQIPAAPVVQVDHERLRAMALALTTPAARTNGAEPHSGAGAAEESTPQDEPADASAQDEPARPSAPEVPDDPNKLRLPRAPAGAVIGPAAALSANAARKRAARSADVKRLKARTPVAPPPEEAPSEPEAPLEPDAAPARAAEREPPQPKKHRGLPEGWVIDDEGFVVPGNG